MDGWEEFKTHKIKKQFNKKRRVDNLDEGENENQESARKSLRLHPVQQIEEKQIIPYIDEQNPSGSPTA